MAQIILDAAAIATLNEKFNNLANANYEVPGIIKTIAERGAENVFYISKSYRGLYEDDDCYFSYWDNVNGEIITDYWTTAAACPNFNLYVNDIITIEQAQENGLLNMDLVKKFNIDNALQAVKNCSTYTHVNAEIIKKYNPIVKVERGRKFRGTAYYITEIETCNNPNYPSRVEAKVLSLDDFQIHYCNPSFIQLVEMDKIVEDYIKWATDIINNVADKNTYSSFFDMNGVTWGIKDESFSFESYVAAHANNIDHLLVNAYDPRREEEKRRLAENRANEYPKILEWVKTKTDVTEESAQIALAIKILNKKY
jgi:hypothetical protein